MRYRSAVRARGLGCDVLPLLVLEDFAAVRLTAEGRQAELLPAGGGYRAAPAT